MQFLVLRSRLSCLATKTVITKETPWIHYRHFMMSHDVTDNQITLNCPISITQKAQWFLLSQHTITSNHTAMCIQQCALVSKLAHCTPWRSQVAETELSEACPKQMPGQGLVQQPSVATLQPASLITALFKNLLAIWYTYELQFCRTVYRTVYHQVSSQYQPLCAKLYIQNAISENQKK